MSIKVGDVEYRIVRPGVFYRIQWRVLDDWRMWPGVFLTKKWALNGIWDLQKRFARIDSRQGEMNNLEEVQVN